MSTNPHRPVPALVALVSLEDLQGYVPEHYVGLVMATGSTVYEAVAALEQRALDQARESATHTPPGPDGSYTLLGLRFSGGISASGQPEWVAYGTLARGFRRTETPG